MELAEKSTVLAQPHRHGDLDQLRESPAQSGLVEGPLRAFPGFRALRMLCVFEAEIPQSHEQAAAAALFELAVHTRKMAQSTLTAPAQRQQ
jgi:hypothetical protein